MGLDCLGRDQISVLVSHVGEIGRKLLDLAGRLVVRCLEDGDDTLFEKSFTLAIAAPRCLCNLIEPGLCSPHTREIEIDACLDERCCDQSAGLSSCQPLAHIGEDDTPVSCILARSQMNCVR